LAVVKKAISLPDHVYDTGVQKTQKLFGGNFSAYICYLISRDREQDDYKPKVKDNKVTKAIDEIINM
jgi:hypothetical protein